MIPFTVNGKRMAYYDFECHGCHARFTMTGPMSDPPTMTLCLKCGSMDIHQDFTGVQFDIFEGYTDIHTTGKPVWLGSKKMRDAFHTAHGVTLDRNRYGGKKKVRPASESVSADEIMDHLKKHGPIKVPKHKIDPSSANRFTIGQGE